MKLIFLILILILSGVLGYIVEYNNIEPIGCLCWFIGIISGVLIIGGFYYD